MLKNAMGSPVESVDCAKMGREAVGNQDDVLLGDIVNEVIVGESSIAPGIY